MASISLSNCLQLHLLHKNPISSTQPHSLTFSFYRLRLPRCCFSIGCRESSYGAEFLRKPVVSQPVEEEEEEEDWEDQIFEDTVPLVGFMRTVLHSGEYEDGDRLSPEHEGTILERLLPYHPEFENKIGCGVDHIVIDSHPNFESSRCLFIVRKDGELVDFSYWKCIKGLIRKNYPIYAESFILKHFTKPRHRN